MRENYNSLNAQIQQGNALPGSLPLWMGAEKGLGKILAGLTASFAMVLLIAITAAAQTAYVPVPPTSTGTSGNPRGPSGAFEVVRASSIYTAAEMAALNPAYPLTSMGFNISTPANLAATGTVKIYLVNTTDASFLRSTVWNTLISTPTAMQLVYDGPLTIPAAIGWYDIAFTTSFNYTGNNIYMAFEWQRTGPATTFPTYNCNATLVGGANGWRGNTGTITAPPADLSQSSNFRPWIRFGYTPPLDDAAVSQVYSLGKIPQNNNGLVPHQVSAVITNMGSQPIVNRTFTLTVSGANTFTATADVANLTFGQSTVLTFPGYTPTNLGVNTITVTAPADDDLNNNSATYTQIVTPQTLTYSQGDPPVLTGAVGINAAGAMGGFFAKHSITGPTQVTVPVVRAGIGNNAASVGRRVFAVVLNAAGVQIGRSAGYIIQAGDLGNLVSFNITTPPTISNTEFYIGLAFTPHTAGYFPMGTQPETPARAATFYGVSGDTTFAGATTFTSYTTLGRFVLEADLLVILPPPVDIAVTAITGVASGCGLSNASQVCATIENQGGDPQSNIPVSLVVNGGTPITATIPGPLLPNTSISYCFTQTIDLSIPGNYDVSVIASMPGDGMPANDSLGITINSMASVPTDFIALPAAVCITDGLVQLNAAPAGGSFSGTGVTGTDFDPSVAGAGTHTLTYTVTQGICSGTATANIIVNDIPAAPTGIDSSTCGPGEVTLAANAAAGNIVWYEDATGGTPIDLGPTFTTPSITTNTTYYAATNNGLLMTGNVGPLDGASVGPGGSTGAFNNEMFFSTTQALRIDSVTMISDGPGTYTIGIRNVLSTTPGSVILDEATVTLPSAGTHRVYLGLMVPAAGNDYTMGLISSSTGAGNLFRNTSGATYPYTLPGLISITGANFDNDPTNTRYYNYYNWSVTAYVGGCESARVPVEASVVTPPDAPLTGDIDICGPDTAQLAASTTGGSIVWYANATGGTPLGTGNTFTTPVLTATTTFYVATLAPGGCESDREPVLVTVNDIPDAAFTFTNTGNSYNFTASATSGTYTWTFASGTPATSSVAAPTVTFPGAGSYVVNLTVTENGCTATTSQTIVILSRDADLNNLLSVYPNPSAGLVQIEVAGSESITRVEIYSALGQHVKTLNFGGQQQVSVDLGELAEGAYTLKVTGQQSTMVKQLLLQK